MPSLPVNTMSTAMYTDGQMDPHYDSMGGYNQALDNATNARAQEGSIQDTLREGMTPMAANEVLGGNFSSF